MPFQPIETQSSYRKAILRDLALAIVLAVSLTVCWTITDWPRLSMLTLPDADDMMRLAQVRDWLDGQAFADWTQYRMAPPLGAPMHWSRINDFGPAAIILALTPFAGRYGAELAAVLIYPGALFACHIVLAARIARRLWSSAAAPIAAILAALAYPGITVFLPGRIDHHALQVVIVEIAILALMQRRSLAGGAVAGVAVATALVVGLETVPQVAALITVLFAFWVSRGTVEQRRLGGFAAALCGSTLMFLATLRPAYWSGALCDAFTPATATGTLLAGGALALLAAASSRLTTWRARLLAGTVLGGLVLGITLASYPACLAGPYGMMDPFLRRAFLPHIDEANGITKQPFWRAVSLGGMLAVACLAASWTLWSRPRRWRTTLPVIAVVLVSGAITLVQARGTYIGAPVAAPLLAGVVLAARRRTKWRTPALIAAWLASTGIAYMQAPTYVSRLLGAAPPRTMAIAQVACSVGDVWQQIDRLPRGVVMAPTNMASYLIGATHQSTVGAGYHRNDRGNMAMYRYFLSSPERSAAIARAWNVRYVAFCPGDFEEIDVVETYPHKIGRAHV